MIENIEILINQGRQSIPDPTRAEVPGIFRGVPEITTVPIDEKKLVSFCPLGAINGNPLSIDLGKCSFCGDCARAFPEKIKFSKDYRMATNDRKRLIIAEGPRNPITLDPSLIRKEITSIFRGSLKLRQVSAGGDNSSELELNASGNVNFDMGRYGIEFVASPRHADGIVITGPISSNMAEPLRLCYEAIPSPKIVVLAGTDAISGGLFRESPAIDRTFLDKYSVDLYVPGNPVHPLTFINGLLDLIRMKSF
jgi:Ni,Fe-hydrogenase III small subunit/NAD-dependent dihydropyrimidine dehydrogenase PreA subunit